MTIPNNGWVISTGQGKLKLKGRVVHMTCPDCKDNVDHVVACKRGHVFDPDEWYHYKKDSNTQTGQIIYSENTATCEKCGAQFFYKLSLVPDLQIFKMTKVEP